MLSKNSSKLKNAISRATWRCNCDCDYSHNWRRSLCSRVLWASRQRQRQSTAMTTTASGYKSTIVLGTTDSVQTTIDPADEYDYFGGEMVNNLGAPLVDFAAGTTDTSASALQPALATSWSVSSDGAYLHIHPQIWFKVLMTTHHSMQHVSNTALTALFN